jgi:uncharacterized phage infection (PIP) family protein YhgE
MAEVKINIQANDNATAHINTVKRSVDELNSAIKRADFSAASMGNIPIITSIVATVVATAIESLALFFNKPIKEATSAIESLEGSIKELNKNICGLAKSFDVVKEFSEAAKRVVDIYDENIGKYLKRAEEIKSKLRLLDKDFEIFKDFEAKIKIKGDFSDLEEKRKRLIEELEGVWKEMFSPFTQGLSSALSEGISQIEKRLKELDSYLLKTLTLDISQAVKAVSEVNSALASIPDVTVKTVVVQYQTQASPLMPFTKGIDHIKELMESLPGEGTYRVKFLGQASPEKGITETVSDVMGMIGGLSDFLSKPSDYWTILWRDDPGRARGKAGQITNTIDRLTDFLREFLAAPVGNIDEATSYYNPC